MNYETVAKWYDYCSFFTKYIIIEHYRTVVQSLSILQQKRSTNLPKYLHTIVIIGYFCKYQSLVLVRAGF